MSIFDSTSAVITDISSLTSSVSNAVSSFSNGIINTIGNLNLPLPNELSNYATHDYILGLGVLTHDQFNNPDSTYMIGQRIELICKSASADPANRVQTQYGQFDFFIDNLTLDSIIGFQHHNSYTSNATFDIYEPYSMGMFVLAVQKAANDAGWKNWMEAPYLITIEFRGWQQNGAPVNIPSTTRYIPIHFKHFGIKASEKGTTYNCEALVTNGKAHSTEHAKTKSDTTIKGKTVQEILQTGEKSLQAVLNARAKQLVDDGIESTPTKYVIMFPDKPQTSSQNSSITSALTSTVSPSAVINGGDLSSVLGMGATSSTGSNVTTNAIGQAKMVSSDRKASASVNDENKVYDETAKIWNNGNVQFDPADSTHTYASTQYIEQIINNVILQSEYPKTALGMDAIDEKGMRQWWVLDTQTYFIKDDANLAKTGTTPKVIVYRIMPYKAHGGVLSAPNVRPPGYDKIQSEIIKRYDYIYTGNNTEVLEFNIDFSNSFARLMPADNLARSQDVLTAAEFGAGVMEAIDWLSSLFSFVKPLFSGLAPSSEPGVLPSQVRYTNTTTTTDHQGGGGQENQGNRAGRTFLDALTNPMEMVNLDMKILGDPYWIPHSGMGNYTSTPTQYKDLNSDMSVNYQSSEVDIEVNFRSPLDLNQATGLYDFGGNSKVAPVIHFSGIYKVTKVVSRLKDGKFTQELHGMRRPQQENPNKGGPDVMFNVKNLFS